MDTRTVAITLILSLAAQTLLASVLAFFRKDRAVTATAVGFGGSVLGFSLLLLQEFLPAWAGVVGANLFVLVFHGSLAVGIRAFLGLPVWPRRFTGYAVLWLFLILVLTYGLNSYVGRSVLTSTAIVVLTVEFFVALQGPGRLEPIAPLIRVYLGLLTLTLAVFHTFRAVAIAFSTAGNLWSDETMTNVMLLFSLISSFFWFGALFLLDAGRLQAEARAHANELNRLNHLKDRVLAMTGHDLRGPMGNLQLLWSDMGNRLRNRDFASIDTEMLSMVDRSLAGTQSLLDNLFSFAQSQQSNTEVETPADLALTLLQVKDQWEPAATTKGVRLVVDVQESVLVRASTGSLDAVFRNLVGNAVKFTPRGGQVTISLLAGPNETRVDVADTGIGMSPEQMQRTFQMESKFSRPGTDGERGSGFGLVLVRELIAGWGGTVAVESESGRGTRVSVTFPRQ